MSHILIGILIPFLGTSLGAAVVFLMKKQMSEKTGKIMEGFAAGVMVSATFFSLLEPALSQSESLGRLSMA